MATTKPQPPAPLPSWMLDLSAAEQQKNHGMLSASYRPPNAGWAEMDQYANGGIPPSGSMGELIQNNFQNLTSISPQGLAMQGLEPTGMDRTGRAISGFFKGYDTGNTMGNVGLQVGASMVPGGQLVNSAAGAIQGATSDAKVFKPMLPEKLATGDPYQRTDGPDFRMGGGVLPQGDTSGTGAGSGAAGGTSPFSNSPFLNGTAPPVQNPLQSPQSGAATTQGQFTGGSGRPVQPYALPGEDDLLTLLANAQRYTDYDASTGRTGLAGGGLSYANAGFDFAQDPGNRDIGKSAKYAFSYFADQAARQGAPMPKTKADAEAWFNQYIAPNMQAAGYEIGWVKGDKARIKAREGWDEIDFLINADGENPTLGWQSEVLAPGGGMSTGAMGRTGTSPAGMDLTSSALFEQLMQQVRDIAAGNSNGALVTDTNALLNLLAR